MELQSYHIPDIDVGELNPAAAFPKVRQLLLSKGLESIIDETEKTFRKFTGPLGLNISLPVILPPFCDLLAQPSNGTLCYLRLVENPLQLPEETQFRTLGADLVIVSIDKMAGSQLLADCELILQGKAIRGTVREAELAERLKKWVKEGPHARWLNDPEFSTSLANLYDPALRGQLSSFVDTFGDSPVTANLIEDILLTTGKLEKSEIRQLINDENLFSKQFSIGCTKCGISALAFSTRESAQESLKHSISRKCFGCGQDSLNVIETFALKQVLLKGLREGLWLEILVHRTIKSTSVFSAAGLVVENFEIDIVSLAWENVMLFECKDTSFGERDFWMSVPKAQTLAADVLWIVTTEPLHENVKRTIDRQKQANFEIFVTEKLTDGKGIISAISEKLEQVQNSLLTNLLGLGHDQYPFVTRRRLGGPLRKLRRA